jgi:hypothetical protein
VGVGVEVWIMIIIGRGGSGWGRRDSQTAREPAVLGGGGEPRGGDDVRVEVLVEGSEEDLVAALGGFIALHLLQMRQEPVVRQRPVVLVVSRK